MSESEKEAILAKSAAESWTCEGAVFYAFGEENPPADAAAVYRFSDERQGYSWAMTAPGEADVPEGYGCLVCPFGGPGSGRRGD